MLAPHRDLARRELAALCQPPKTALKTFITLLGREGNSSGFGGDLGAPHGLMFSFSFLFENRSFFPVFCLLWLMLLDMSAGFDLFLFLHYKIVSCVT